MSDESNPERISVPLMLASQPDRWYPCPRCGTEWSLPIVGKCNDCATAEAAKAAKPMHVPSRFADATFGSPALVERLGGAGARETMVRAWRSVRSARVVITGQGSGIGKTSLACAMLQEWNKRHRGVGRYASALKVASEGYQADDRLGSCPLLLLDDLGEETASASSKIPAIVFERYDEGLPLWVTTSRPKDDLERRYGDGFVRRIFEGAAVIEVTGRKGQR